MTKQMEYADYRPEKMASRMQPMTEPESGRLVGYTGLADYNIPRSLLLTATSSGGLIVELQYPEFEKPEHREYRLEPSGVRLRLGRYTRRVQEIHAPDIRAFLVRQRGVLDPDVVAEIANEFPSRLAKILVRTAALVSEILSTMPDVRRNELFGFSREARAANE